MQTPTHIHSLGDGRGHSISPAPLSAWKLGTMKWNLANLSFLRRRRKKSVNANANTFEAGTFNVPGFASAPNTLRRNSSVAFASMATVTYSTFYAAEWSPSEATMPFGDYANCPCQKGVVSRRQSCPLTRPGYRSTIDRSACTMTPTHHHSPATNDINTQFLNTLECNQSLALSKHAHVYGDAAIAAGAEPLRTDSWMRNFDCVLKRNSAHLSPSSTSVLLENYL